MKILFVASECAPLAKVGGLADVVGSLPKALRSLGIDVRIALPKYDVIDQKKYPSKIIGARSVPFLGTEETVMLHETVLPGSDVPLSLLEHARFLGNGGVYIEADASSGGSNAELNRFGLFARAIPELIRTLGWAPDIIHCHDWQTGSLPSILKTLSSRAGERGQENHLGGSAGMVSPDVSGDERARELSGSSDAGGTDRAFSRRYPLRTLFTIHNLAYQGIHPRNEVEKALGKEIADSLSPHPHNTKQINFLSSALKNVDRVTTVSPRYAQEITTKEFGCGLDHILRDLSHAPMGILNGIDTEYWNPATDHFLAHHYTTPAEAEKIKPTLKRKLLASLDLPLLSLSPSSPFLSPLLVMISRLTGQKGFDILIPALETLLPQENFQCAILASGDKTFATRLHALAHKYPDKLHFVERFDEPLAHHMYAAGDFFLMPSHFEPCGLGQMIAMRYGAIPIATAVGGLRDTVQEEETGFVTPHYTTEALIKTMKHAFIEYRNTTHLITALRTNGMQKDFSWKHSAQEYVRLYQDVLKTQETRYKDTKNNQ